MELDKLENPPRKTAPIKSPPSFPPPRNSSHEDVQKWLAAAEPILKNASARWIAARVAVFLKGHFWIDWSEPEMLTKAIGRDWIKALRPHSAWAIDSACIEWLSNNSQAPQICDLVKIARRVESALQIEIRHAKLILNPPPACPRYDLPLTNEEKNKIAAGAKIWRQYRRGSRA